MYSVRQSKQRDYFYIYLVATKYFSEKIKLSFSKLKADFGCSFFSDSGVFTFNF